jgi:hypothetical protein
MGRRRHIVSSLGWTVQREGTDGFFDPRTQHNLLRGQLLLCVIVAVQAPRRGSYSLIPLVLALFGGALGSALVAISLFLRDPG